ncbi:hypothetical protein LXM94_11250 [Rhizobium sp. TRM95111]|uniref:hypothetical protein n=1 Tax=Rhizobium alarense TaxID=2846851 RepID=UPI001F2AC45E|nr:hypothetical protein [Rhizobium alarense]MCF3640539.1 hypothetical protein [Rhizobium alarense]
MMNFLPALHEGHAPIALQHLFRDALEAFDDWENGAPEPTVAFDDRPLPISIVFQEMRRCTDIVPHAMIGIVLDSMKRSWQGEDPFDRMSFSTASRIMGVLIRKRRLHGKAGAAAFIAHRRPDRSRH